MTQLDRVPLSGRQANADYTEGHKTRETDRAISVGRGGTSVLQLGPTEQDGWRAC